MAALTQEKLLRVLKGKKRGHEFLDPEGFDTRMDKLVNAPVKTGRKTTGSISRTPTKKAQIKKKAAARKKTATN
jgi:hypothetical protein